jgi:TrmH family RNA methyltransferase
LDRAIITSLSNPQAKQIRALRQRKGRALSGLFVVEGLHPVGEAIEAGWDIDSILYAPDVLTSSFANALLVHNASKLQPVSHEVMDALADKENPQGILAIVHQRRVALSEISQVRRAVGMVAPQDPGNVGTVLRTMDAVDAHALILVDGGVDPYHPTSVRASMGALFWKPVVQVSFAELLTWSGSHEMHLVGTSAHAEIDYRRFAPVEPWLLLLGSEQKGLSPDRLAACEAAISLPMRGRASSLNLAVAAGILLYQFTS